MTDKAKQGRVNREKGKRFERKVAAAYRARGFPAERESHGRRQTKSDLKGGPEFAVIECRDKKTYSIHTELAAVKELCAASEYPLLITNHRGMMVAHLPFEELLSLQKARESGW